MSEVITPKATSTPNDNQKKSKVLKENKKDINELSREMQKKFPKKVFSYSTPKKMKENVRRVKLNRSAPPSDTENSKNEKKEEERRLAAIEAMKIQENRRQRMMSQQVADDSEENEQKQPIESTTEKDPLVEKKRLEAKLAKEKRIKQFLAEQEARKLKEAEEAKFLAEQEARKQEEAEEAAKVVHPPIVQEQSQAACQLNKNPIPKFPSKTNRRNKPKIPRFGSHIVQQFPVPTVAAYVPMFACFKKSQTPHPFIRYSKDDLRSMNPYGYYFM